MPRWTLYNIDLLDVVLYTPDKPCALDVRLLCRHFWWCLRLVVRCEAGPVLSALVVRHQMVELSETVELSQASETTKSSEGPVSER